MNTIEYILFRNQKSKFYFLLNNLYKKKLNILLFFNKNKNIYNKNKIIFLK